MSEWWEPELADEKYVARLRTDYPEKCEGMSDDWVRDHFNEIGGKYVATWDHVGDAYEQFEELADSYLALRKVLGEITTMDGEQARHAAECALRGDFGE